jgi:hypothetical protein
MAFYYLQQRKIELILQQMGDLLWNPSTTSLDRNRVRAFCIFTVLMLVLEKTILTSKYFCEGRITHSGYDPGSERAKFEEFLRLTEREFLERCKENFHRKFKTRKGGKESRNPIRDTTSAWHKSTLDERTTKFVEDLQRLTNAFGKPRPQFLNLFHVPAYWRSVELDIDQHRSSNST